MTPDEVELVAGWFTSGLFNERPPRQDLAMRRTQEDRSNLSTPEIGIKDGKLELPKRAVTGVPQLSLIASNFGRNQVIGWPLNGFHQVKARKHQGLVLAACGVP